MCGRKVSFGSNKIPRNFASDLTGRATPFKKISGSGCSPRFRQKCMQIVFWLDITKPLEFVQSVILRIAICSCLSIVLDAALRDTFSLVKVSRHSGSDTNLKNTGLKEILNENW
ncbi:hypothetical protein JTE90_004181 [Oedothorax gibbosus]|uniref:Uncharacterized protein n=1 Tax=Oedothorax gibbosus TaxID=931172 RepID=A0AAV6TUW7_9ARAC|nr:hypothetical protein JTE90_004181 [Oedothorax gibbosus]